MRIVPLGPQDPERPSFPQDLRTLRHARHHREQRDAASRSRVLRTGRMAKEAMDTARVTDELLLRLLRIQMPQMDLDKGFILVDLPKNAGQADVLDSVLSDLGAEVELALNLERWIPTS